MLETFRIPRVAPFGRPGAPTGAAPSSPLPPPLGPPLPLSVCGGGGQRRPPKSPRCVSPPSPPSLLALPLLHPLFRPRASPAGWPAGGPDLGLLAPDPNSPSPDPCMAAGFGRPCGGGCFSAAWLAGRRPGSPPPLPWPVIARQMPGGWVGRAPVGLHRLPCPRGRHLGGWPGTGLSVTTGGLDPPFPAPCSSSRGLGRLPLPLPLLTVEGAGCSAAKPSRLREVSGPAGTRSVIGLLAGPPTGL